MLYRQTILKTKNKEAMMGYVTLQCCGGKTIDTDLVYRLPTLLELANAQLDEEQAEKKKEQEKQNQILKNGVQRTEPANAEAGTSGLVQSSTAAGGAGDEVKNAGGPGATSGEVAATKDAAPSSGLNILV